MTGDVSRSYEGCLVFFLHDSVWYKSVVLTAVGITAPENEFYKLKAICEGKRNEQKGYIV